MIVRHKNVNALTIDYGDYDPWDALCKAIIISAVEDYRKALIHNKKSEIIRIESFLRSNWAEDLSGIPGEKIINTVRKQVNATNKRTI